MDETTGRPTGNLHLSELGEAALLLTVDVDIECEDFNRRFRVTPPVGQPGATDREFPRYASAFITPRFAAVMASMPDLVALVIGSDQIGTIAPVSASRGRAEQTASVLVELARLLPQHVFSHFGTTPHQ